MNRSQVAVMGVGWVGGALLRYFQDAGRSPIAYDPPKGMGSKEELAKADVVFICVPTPYRQDGEGFDLSFVEAAVEALPPGKIVVIKSTVLPGTTESLQAKYPQHTFLFNPEFLREKTADADLRNPDRQIIGTTAASAGLADDVLALLPKAPFTRAVRATEAEAVKYFGNCFLAMKVVFANQMFDVCRTLGVDYDSVKECSAADGRIGPSHLEVRQDGYRGYAGSCFPKDVRAFIQLGERIGIDVELMKTVERLNNELVSNQSLCKTN
jgi:UDPglucose 6-dehydrogenase